MTDTITLPRSVVEQALKALEKADRISGYRNNWAEVNSLIAALEQPQVEQEPVAWIEHEWSGSGLRHLHFERPAPTVRDEVVRPVWTPLYTHPQPRQPLTDEQIDKIADGMPGGLDGFMKGWGWRQFARAVEAHGIRGEE